MLHIYIDENVGNYVNCTGVLALASLSEATQVKYDRFYFCGNPQRWSKKLGVRFSSTNGKKVNNTIETKTYLMKGTRPIL